MDYRYFPDPDLLPLEISDEWIAEVRREMPELPAVMKNRFLTEYGLKEDEVAQLASDRHLAEYFDEVVRLTKDAKNAANWIRGEVLSRLNEAGIAISESPLSAQTLAQILIRFKDGTINQKGARTLIAELWDKTGESVDGLIEKLGIKQISDSSAIEAVIDQVLAENQAMVEEFRSGKEKAFNALVGRVMRASKGKANPAQVNELLRAKL
jgi:aspartyl-tRNA(Asn)/glutamyl-tRNA(Gln) amidotransferase subunit B